MQRNSLSPASVSSPGNAKSSGSRRPSENVSATITSEEGHAVKATNGKAGGRKPSGNAAGSTSTSSTTPASEEEDDSALNFVQFAMFTPGDPISQLTPPTGTLDVPTPATNVGPALSSSTRQKQQQQQASQQRGDGDAAGKTRAPPARRSIAADLELVAGRSALGSPKVQVSGASSPFSRPRTRNVSPRSAASRGMFQPPPTSFDGFEPPSGSAIGVAASMLGAQPQMIGGGGSWVEDDDDDDADDAAEGKEYSPRVIQKTAAEEAEIRAAIQVCHLLSNMDPDTLTTIINAFAKEEFSAGTAVMSQGGACINKFFLVTNGTCDIIKFGKNVAVLDRGSTFGELEMMSEATAYVATIRCVTNCTMYVLRKKDFVHLVMDYSLRQRKLYEKMLGNVRFLQALPAYEREKLAEGLTSTVYSKDDVIIEFGEPGKMLHIILKGEVQVVSHQRGKSINVVRLSVGDVVGELEFLFGHLAVADVVAVTDTVVTAQISRQQFEVVVGPINTQLKHFVSQHQTYQHYLTQADDVVKHELQRITRRAKRKEKARHGVAHMYEGSVAMTGNDSTPATTATTGRGESSGRLSFSASSKLAGGVGPNLIGSIDEKTSPSSSTMNTAGRSGWQLGFDGHGFGSSSANAIMLDDIDRDGELVLLQPMQLGGVDITTALRSTGNSGGTSSPMNGTSAPMSLLSAGSLDTDPTMQNLPTASLNQQFRGIPFRFPMKALEAANVALFALREDGVILFWNSTMERYTGYTRDEVVGQNVYSFLYSSHDQKVLHSSLKTACEYAGDVEQFYIEAVQECKNTYTFARSDGLTKANVQITLVPPAVEAEDDDVAAMLLAVGQEIRNIPRKTLDHGRIFSDRVRQILQDGARTYEERLNAIADQIASHDALLQVLHGDPTGDDGDHLRVVSVRQLIGQIIMENGSDCFSRSVRIRQQFDDGDMSSMSVFIDSKRLPECLRRTMWLSTSRLRNAEVTISVSTALTATGLEFLQFEFFDSKSSLTDDEMMCFNTSSTAASIDSPAADADPALLERLEVILAVKQAAELQGGLICAELFGNSMSDLSSVSGKMARVGSNLPKMISSMRRNAPVEDTGLTSDSNPAGQSMSMERDKMNPSTYTDAGSSGVLNGVSIFLYVPLIPATEQSDDVFGLNQSMTFGQSTSSPNGSRAVGAPSEQSSTPPQNLLSGILSADVQQSTQTVGSTGTTASTQAKRRNYTTLVVEDTPAHRNMLCTLLWERKHAVLPAQSADDLHRLLDNVDILIIDPQQSVIAELTATLDPFKFLCSKLNRMGIIITGTNMDANRLKAYHTAGFLTLAKPCSTLQAFQVLRGAEDRVAVMKSEAERIAQTRETLARNSRGEWRKLRLLGQGVSGEVFEAVDVLTGGMMAVKEMRKGGNTNLDRFVEEVATMYELQHPHIIHYFYCEDKPEDPIIRVFMEYAGGGNLQTLLGSKANITSAEQRHLLRGIVEGLAYIHSQQYIHRDIKTANILLGADGEPRIGDFGTAKRVQPGELLFDMQGSPLYMSPECMSAGDEIEDGEGDNNGSGGRRRVGYSFPSDIWSLGCVALEIATMKPPFSHLPNSGPVVFMTYICSLTQTPDLHKVLANCSSSMKEFIYACLQPNPAKRPTAAELLNFPVFTEETDEQVQSALTVIKRAQMLDMFNQMVSMPREDGDESEDSYSSKGKTGKHGNDKKKGRNRGSASDLRHVETDREAQRTARRKQQQKRRARQKESGLDQDGHNKEGPAKRRGRRGKNASGGINNSFSSSSNSSSSASDNADNGNDYSEDDVEIRKLAATSDRHAPPHASATVQADDEAEKVKPSKGSSGSNSSDSDDGWSAVNVTSAGLSQRAGGSGTTGDGGAVFFADSTGSRSTGRSSSRSSSSSSSGSFFSSSESESESSGSTNGARRVNSGTAGWKRMPLADLFKDDDGDDGAHEGGDGLDKTNSGAREPKSSASIRASTSTLAPPVASAKPSFSIVSSTGQQQTTTRTEDTASDPLQQRQKQQEGAGGNEKLNAIRTATTNAFSKSHTPTSPSPSPVPPEKRSSPTLSSARAPTEAQKATPTLPTIQNPGSIAGKSDPAANNGAALAGDGLVHAASANIAQLLSQRSAAETEAETTPAAVTAPPSGAVSGIFEHEVPQNAFDSVQTDSPCSSSPPPPLPREGTITHAYSPTKASEAEGVTPTATFVSVVPPQATDAHLQECMLSPVGALRKDFIANMNAPSEEQKSNSAMPSIAVRRSLQSLPPMAHITRATSSEHLSPDSNPEVLHAYPPSSNNNKNNNNNSGDTQSEKRGHTLVMPSFAAYTSLPETAFVPAPPVLAAPPASPPPAVCRSPNLRKGILSSRALGSRYALPFAPSPPSQLSNLTTAAALFPPTTTSGRTSPFAFITSPNAKTGVNGNTSTTSARGSITGNDDPLGDRVDTQAGGNVLEQESSVTWGVELVLNGSSNAMNAATSLADPPQNAVRVADLSNGRRGSRGSYADLQRTRNHSSTSDSNACPLPKVLVTDDAAGGLYSNRRSSVDRHGSNVSRSTFTCSNSTSDSKSRRSQSALLRVSNLYRVSVAPQPRQSISDPNHSRRAETPMGLRSGTDDSTSSPRTQTRRSDAGSSIRNMSVSSRSANGSSRTTSDVQLAAEASKGSPSKAAIMTAAASAASVPGGGGSASTSNVDRERMLLREMWRLSDQLIRTDRVFAETNRCASEEPSGSPSVARDERIKTIEDVNRTLQELMADADTPPLNTTSEAVSSTASWLQSGSDSKQHQQKQQRRLGKYNEGEQEKETGASPTAEAAAASTERDDKVEPTAHPMSHIQGKLRDHADALTHCVETLRQLVSGSNYDSGSEENAKSSNDANANDVKVESISE